MSDLVLGDGDVVKGEHERAVLVEVGVSAEIAGTVSGPVRIGDGATLILRASALVQGAVHVSDHARLVVHGDLLGALNVSSGALVEIEQDGRVFGGLNNAGHVVNRGMRGGPVNGHEPLDEGGKVLPPDPAGKGFTLNVPPRRR